jgi:hypothetical protein
MYLYLLFYFIYLFIGFNLSPSLSGYGQGSSWNIPTAGKEEIFLTQPLNSNNIIW